MRGATIKMTKCNWTNIAMKKQHGEITFFFFSEITNPAFHKKYASGCVLISLRCPTAVQKCVITRSVNLRQLPSYANELVRYSFAD